MELPAERRFLPHVQSQYRRADWRPALDVRFQQAIDEDSIRAAVLTVRATAAAWRRSPLLYIKCFPDLMRIEQNSLQAFCKRLSGHERAPVSDRPGPRPSPRAAAHSTSQHSVQIGYEQASPFWPQP